jgi:hypothetical protein
MPPCVLEEPIKLTDTIYFCPGVHLPILSRQFADPLDISGFGNVHQTLWHYG